jgi:transglutaminase-like putative cysteine protease
MTALRVRYRVTHQTQYRYVEPVASARQLAHLRPRAAGWQTVIEHAVDIHPPPTERSDDIDYLGNHVLRFAIDGLHDQLTVHAESIVEVASHAPPANAVSPPWEKATARIGEWGAGEDLDVVQYRVTSPLAPKLAEAAEYARVSFTPGRPWLQATTELTRRIRTEFKYDPEATTVSTPVSEVIGHKRGVCQDFAHLMISCLRSLSLPARYVSGYVLNNPAPGKQRLAGADASHAWVAAHCPGMGWVAFDPTNGKLADIEFVTVSWGRDFSDVTPLRGVVLGGGAQRLSVRVSVRPLP